MKLPPRPRSRTRLRIEPLEDRATPAAVTVTTLDDIVDGDTSNIANLTATPGADGLISLREAILAAGGDAAADVIDFASALQKGTINLVSFDTGLDDGEVGPTAFIITSPITIAGSGQVMQRDLSGQPSPFRLFQIQPDGNLTLESLEIANGFAVGGDGNEGGGGAAGLGGAIFNQGSLTIRNSTFVNNTAQGGNGGTFIESSGGGGGLGESASGQDGGGPNGGSFEGTGDGGFGGGGSGGSEGDGGAGGFGGGGGGGIFGGGGGAGGFGSGGGGGAGSGAAQGQGGFGALPGSDGNGGGGAGMGGAVFNLLGTLNIANSTFTGNAAQGGFSGGGGSQAGGLGGGLFNLNGTVIVINSTFSANIATNGGQIYNLEFPAIQGVPAQKTALVTLANSIFADSRTGTSTRSPASAAEVVNDHEAVPATATIDASAPNITNQNGFVNINGNLDASGLITATVPVTETALADNGGLTRTLALATGSEAIDSGDNGAAIDPVTEAALSFDQRGDGFARISNGTVDLGAFEVQATSPPPPPPPTLRPDQVVFTSNTAVATRNAPPEAAAQVDPFPDFNGENRVTLGDVNNDGTQDYIYAAGSGGSPRIKVVDGRTGGILRDFFAYDMGFTGGVYVASADFNGDGFDDIVTGAGYLGGPHIRVFSGIDQTPLANFFAFDPNDRNGVTVAAGDVTGDAVPDIAAGAVSFVRYSESGSNLPGFSFSNASFTSGQVTPLLVIVDGTRFASAGANGQILPEALYGSINLASLPEFATSIAMGGVSVAIGDVSGDGRADVLVGPYAVGNVSQETTAGIPLPATGMFNPPRIVTLDGTNLQKIGSVLAAADNGLNTGVRIVAADVDGDGVDDAVVTAGQGGGPHVVTMNALTGEVFSSEFVFDSNLRTGFSIGSE